VPLFNYRDLGGHPVPGGRLRTGLLFRSNAVVGLPNEVAARLGLRTALDLREPGEKSAEPPTAGSAQVHEVELIQADPTVPHNLRPFTFWLAEQRGHLLADAVRVLAHEPMPTVMFCSSGKDRTGVLAAIVQLALGVAEHAVVDDYAQTEKLMPPDYLALALERSRRAGLPEDQSLDDFGSPPDLLLAVLDGIRERHGNATQYLLDHGLDRSHLDRLRERLIEI
jgi:protein-tyrosine phosphatase